MSIRPLTSNEDARGWLIELFRNDELPAEQHPLMAYVSLTRPRVTRGPHEHRLQSDLFCFLGPSTFKLYLWDNRPNSKTFGSKEAFELGQSSRATVIIPPGVVHAYKNIGEIDGLVFNAPNRLYGGNQRQEEIDEIRYEENHNSPFALF